MNSPETAAGRPANRLIDETSPYLRQHAYNPVQWHPWGEAALDEARRRDLPIFLSVGYSACHWCHVMEHESFENPEIARLMNDWFINIKVDREERPDLDQIYMTAVQLLTRSGGWPMSVFLTPQLKPFFGGTYWPPENRWGRPGFAVILQKVHEAWIGRRDEVERGATELAKVIRSAAEETAEPSGLDISLLQTAQQHLLEYADRRAGGFGNAPKFPHAADLRLLLRCWKRFGTAEALDVVRLSLDKMAAGGMYDQLGGGFHRYSTDAEWLVPHFEKMLYDNALLTTAYLEGWQATGNEDYLRIVRETLDYTLRELERPGGGFFSAQDADSEGVEGKFFVWDEAEIDALCEPRMAAAFKAYYGVTPHGNWEERNILHRPQPAESVARSLGLSPGEMFALLAEARRRLFARRAERVAPGTDHKILVSWNGMLLTALAQAAQVLSEPRYAAAAERTADFLLARLRRAEGALWHCFTSEQVKIPAFLDDYACLIDGLTELFQATHRGRYLQAAVSLADIMRREFHDAPRGGFYFTPAHQADLIARSKESSDSSTPSGNSMAATALLKLGRLTGRADFIELGVGTLRDLSGVLARNPLAGGQALLALDFWLGPGQEIVLLRGSDPARAEALRRTVHSRFLPHKIVVQDSAESDGLESSLVQPLLAGKSAMASMATGYVCQGETCSAPVTTPEELQSLLG